MVSPLAVAEMATGAGASLETQGMGGTRAGEAYWLFARSDVIPSRFCMSAFMDQWMWPTQFLPMERERLTCLLISEAGRPGSSELLMREVAMPGQTGREPCARHQLSSAENDCFLGESRQ